MSKKKLDELDEIQRMEKSGDKAIEVVSSIGMSLATTSILSAMLGVANTSYIIPFLTGGTLLTSPIMYLGMKKVKNKMDERFERDLHHVAQMQIMAQETKELDRKIGRMTSLFLQEILEVFDEENKDFPQNQIMPINQLINLINCNYYEKIAKAHPELDREDVVRKIVQQTSMYLNNSARKKFDETDAKIVVNACLFIPESVKEEIVTEFKKSKVKFFDETHYEIIRNDTNGDLCEYNLKKASEVSGQYTAFDIENGNDYYEIISTYTNNSFWIDEELGDPNGLDWDIDFLRTIIKTIVRDHRQELRKSNPDYSNFKLAGDFIFNALSYALVNGRQEVGRVEMLNTFKNWNYIPFDMKLAVLDTIFEEQGIEQNEHPFGISEKRPKPAFQKIIQFPKNESE